MRAQVRRRDSSCWTPRETWATWLAGRAYFSALATWERGLKLTEPMASRDSRAATILKPIQLRLCLCQGLWNVLLLCCTQLHWLIAGPDKYRSLCDHTSVDRKQKATALNTRPADFWSLPELLSASHIFAAGLFTKLPVVLLPSVVLMRRRTTLGAQLFTPRHDRTPVVSSAARTRRESS